MKDTALPCCAWPYLLPVRLHCVRCRGKTVFLTEWQCAEFLFAFLRNTGQAVHGLWRKAVVDRTVAVTCLHIGAGKQCRAHIGAR